MTDSIYSDDKKSWCSSVYEFYLLTCFPLIPNVKFSGNNKFYLEINSCSLNPTKKKSGLCCEVCKLSPTIYDAKAFYISSYFFYCKATTKKNHKLFTNLCLNEIWKSLVYSFSL